MNRKQISKILIICISILLLLSGCKTSNSSLKQEESDSLKWWQKTIVYEAYPNSFKDTDGDGYGDLKGITEKLEYLHSLGVGAIWLTPVYASPMKDNGYDVSDYYAINPRYGSMEDMDELIAKAKQYDIRIVMDLVFNHTSNECEWFKQSSKSRDNDKSDWYIWKDPAPNGDVPNNWRGIFGGSAWTWCEERGQYYLHTFGDFQPDLNWENPEVRKALYEIANFWVDKGVGGFRLDAIPYIKKPAFESGVADGSDGMVGIHNMTANTEGILDFLHEFKQNVQDGTDIFTVGEANGVKNKDLIKWIGDDGVFDMIFSFDLVNITLKNGEKWYKANDFTLKEFKSILADMQNSTADNGWASIFFENHDQPRSINHFLDKDTDQVLGAKALSTILLTLRGTPFIYEGEEIGMTNVDRDSIEEYNDISSINQYNMAISEGLTPQEAMKCVRAFSRDNARSPMQWDTSDNAGFTLPTSKPWLPVASNYKDVNVKKEEEDENSVLSWYRKLACLREEYPVLINGNYKELLNDSEKIYAYQRENNNTLITVLINFTNEIVEYDKSVIENSKLLLSDYDDSINGKLKPFETAIYVKSK